MWKWYLSEEGRTYSDTRDWYYIDMVKSRYLKNTYKIKGFKEDIDSNETRHCRITKCRKEYVI